MVELCSQAFREDFCLGHATGLSWLHSLSRSLAPRIPGTSRVANLFSGPVDRPAPHIVRA